MPKTLVYQGLSALREEVVRSEGCTSRSPVLQEIITFFSKITALTFLVGAVFLLLFFAALCYYGVPNDDLIYGGYYGKSN